jgi:hypothetical protein
VLLKILRQYFYRWLVSDARLEVGRSISASRYEENQKPLAYIKKSDMNKARLRVAGFDSTLTGWF